MNFDEIAQNLLSALSKLLALRLIVSSKSEKIADLPAVYVLLCALLAPMLCAALLVFGLLLRYSARFEHDAYNV